MKAIATKQPTHESAKQNKNGGKGRSRSISPLSTGMPLLQRQCACGGGCPRCQDELGIQTKLKISEPGDKYEQEADHIADEVMQMPEPSVQRQTEPEEEEEEMVQRKALDNPVVSSVLTQESSEVPPIVHEVLNSPGQTLDPETRAFMESRFGHNFSQVRVHTDAKAAESAQALKALAYTVGRNIVFETGQYSPITTTGKKLLAHELTHTLQQSGQSFQSIASLPGSFIQRQSRVRITSSYQTYNIVSLLEDPLEVGAQQVYHVVVRNPDIFPRNISFFWTVYNQTMREIVWQETTNNAWIRLTASEPGLYRVIVIIMVDGQPLTREGSGAVHAEIEQRVRSSSSSSQEEEIPQRGAGIREGFAQHILPSCDGSLPIEINQARTFELGQIDRPADNCSFTPIFSIDPAARSVRIIAHADNPPSDDDRWSITLFECPESFMRGGECDQVRTGRSGIIGGSINTDLNYHFDPTLWISRKIFIRIRNGSEAPIPNVRLTLEPQFRDPIIQAIHDGLAILGLIPGLGVFADAADATIYFIEGDWVEVGITIAAMVPVFGEGATITRLGSRQVIRASQREVELLGRDGIEAGIRRVRQETTERAERGAIREAEESTARVVAGARRLPRELFRCRIGSLFCPIEFLHSRPEFQEHFRERLSFLDYLGELPERDLDLGPSPRSLERARRDVLRGDSMYRQYLETIGDEHWSEPFREVMDRIWRSSAREGSDYRRIITDGAEYRWPHTGGQPWTVHHEPPLEFIGGEDSELWRPIPLIVHDDVGRWWRNFRRSVLDRVPPELRREVIRGDIDVDIRDFE